MAKKIGKNIIMTIMIPVIMFVFFYALCAVTGKGPFDTAADFSTSFILPYIPDYLR